MIGHSAGVPRAGEARSFHGSLVISTWLSGAWWDTVAICRDRLVLRPWARPRTELSRSDLAVVEFEPFGWNPVLWKTASVYFRLTDGSRAPRSFNPIRLQAFRAALGDLEWLMRDLPPE